MFKINDLHRHAVAAIGAILVSFTIMGASIAPADIGSPTAASRTI